MEKRKTLQPQQPAVVKDAAFLQNTKQGAEVDLARFPAPIWHRHDGGPFIGSGSIVIMRDPDRGDAGGGWINASIYRVQVHGRNKVTVQFDHAGRHGAIIARKYWEAGQALSARRRQRPGSGAVHRRLRISAGRDNRNTSSPAPSKARRSRSIPDR